MVFEKPIEEIRGYFKPLYIKAYINNKMLSRVIVNGRALLNVMPINTLEKIGKV